MSGYVRPDRALILKTRMGNGDSAVDVEWLDDDLRWRVSARSFSAFWFDVPTGGKEGYDEAMKLADQLESMLQRMVRHRAEAKGDEDTVRAFVNEHREPVFVTGVSEG